MNVRVLAAITAALCVIAYGMAARTAHGQPYGDWWLGESIALWNNVWQTPCDGQFSVTVEPLQDTVVGWAWANWTTRPHSDCAIALDDDLRGGRLCSVLGHEMGHLAGMEHSRNPRSVMFPTLRRVDPRCKRLFYEGRYWT